MEYLVQPRSNSLLLKIGIVIFWSTLLVMVATGIYIITLFNLTRYTTSAIAAIYVVSIVSIGNVVDKWWWQRMERQQYYEDSSTTDS